MRRYKAIQEALTADSAAAVADMTGEEQKQETELDFVGTSDSFSRSKKHSTVLLSLCSGPQQLVGRLHLVF